MINEYGGQMPDAIGIPEDMLREAAKMAVCKINVDSDIRIAMTAAIRKHFIEKPGDFDPRKYLAPARDLIEEVVSHKSRLFSAAQTKRNLRKIESRRLAALFLSDFSFYDIFNAVKVISNFNVYVAQKKNFFVQRAVLVINYHNI